MNINKLYREGAKGALLDEYEKAIIELNMVINDIGVEDLIIVIDPITKDPNCKSVQTILSHVISSGFNYAISIRKLKDKVIPFREPQYLISIEEYQKQLLEVFDYTVTTFNEISDIELEEHDNSKKIISRWGQIYDIEQLMEHAIVHILRHRRQIERFLLKLRNVNT